MRLAVLLCISACRISLDDVSPDAGDGPLSPSCAEATSHSDFAWIQDNIFTPSCAFSSCHSGLANQAGHLSLQAPFARNQLVNVAATTKQGWMRVVPDMVDQSYLLVAIGEQSGPAPDGGTMPIGGAPLCQQKKDAVRR